MKFLPIKATDEQAQTRLTICRACEFHGTGYVLNLELCKACGCPLASKTQIQQSTCPKGKW